MALAYAFDASYFDGKEHATTLADLPPPVAQVFSRRRFDDQARPTAVFFFVANGITPAACLGPIHSRVVTYDGRQHLRSLLRDLGEEQQMPGGVWVPTFWTKASFKGYLS